MAYTAAYHFVRQQYGFMRIYSRKEAANKYYRVIDAITIYAATIYPLCCTGTCTATGISTGL